MGNALGVVYDLCQGSQNPEILIKCLFFSIYGLFGGVARGCGWSLATGGFGFVRGGGKTKQGFG